MMSNSPDESPSPEKEALSSSSSRPPGGPVGREDKAPPLRMPPKKSLLTHHRPTAPDDPSSAEKPEDPSSVVEELKSPTPQPTLQAGDPSRLGGVKERMKEEAAPAPVLVPEVSAPPPEPAPEPVSAPSPEPEKVSESQPVVPASTPRAQKPRKPEPVHSPALTQAMKRLQSQGPFTEKVAVSNTEASVAMAASTLPETMARLDLESRFQAKLHQTAQADRPVEPPVDEEKTGPKPTRVDDPSPGWAKATSHFFLSFGRFINGVQLAQPLSITLTLWLVCALTFLLPAMPFWVGNVTSPYSIFTGGFVLRGLLVGVGGGILGFAVLGLLFSAAVWTRFKRISFWMGLRVVSAAFLPLAVVQILALFVSSAFYGEAFWRGASPGGFTWMRVWLFPLLWMWGGFRIGQALLRLLDLPLKRQVGVLVGLPLVFLLLCVPFHPWFEARRAAPPQDALAHISEWQEERHWDSALKEVEDLIARLPYRSEEMRRKLFRMQIDLLARLERYREARVVCRQLELCSLPGSGSHALARGVNLFLHGERLDLAEQRLKEAVQVAPEEAAPRLWLARLYRLEEPDQARVQLKALVKIDDRLDYVNLYMQVLRDLEQPEAIWEAMFLVRRPVEAWPLEMLQTGLEASETLGKEKRAAVLRDWIQRKTAPDVGKE